MKVAALSLIVLVLFNSCYTYKPLNPVEDEFIVGEKYEIRIGDQKKQRVHIKEVNDSTLLVIQNKTVLVVQRAMIAESRKMDFSMGKTILASTVGVLLTLITLGALMWNDSNQPLVECC